MNILNLVRHPIGGIRSYFRYNYSLLDASYTTTVVTIAVPEAAILAGVTRPVSVELSLVAHQRPFARLLGRARQLIASGRFDLIHSQGLTAAVVAVLANTPRRLPHVLTLHETLQRGQFAPPLGFLKARALGRVVARTDRIIVVTQDAFENLREYVPMNSASLSRVEVIRHGVSVDALVEDARTTSPTLRITSVQGPEVVIGFVGRFMPEKGFPVLIEAVEHLVRSYPGLPPFRVVAVNDGAFVREYRNHIEERGLGNYFAFLGLQASIAGLLLEFDAVVMPSLREACGLVAIEAMVMGCPLVVSDCIGLREVTRGSPALVSRTGDAASLSETLHRVIMAPRPLKDAAAAYSVKARIEFDSRRAATRLDEVFREVVAER